MEKRILGKSNLEVSAIGLGCMGMSFSYGPPKDQKEMTALLHAAVEQGVTFFDTAEIYGAGHGEEVLGAALRDRRAKAVIATKFSPANSPTAALVAACEASLKRLGTDVIDLYQTHWPNPAVPLEDIARGFETLVQSGKVRAVGFSNATAALMGKMATLLPSTFPLATAQQEYNLAERFVERAVLPFCQTRGMALLAYSPLGQGKLMAGDMLKNLAANHGTTPAALALQWLMRQPRTIPIPMTSQKAHLENNLKAALTPISDDLVAEVGALFQPRILDIPVQAIEVVGSHTGKSYLTLDAARANNLQLSPSPQALARELADGEMLKPVKVRPKEGAVGAFELYEGQLRYWAWRLAHNDALPIPALVS